MENEARRQATSFGAVADVYARARPSYPAAAIQWMLGDRPGRVLDLGAGTGKLTAALREAGADVVAVEPLAEMRAELSALVPGIEVLAGTAERIPLPDGSVDAVVAGQAYHWFDLDVAVPEIARVLRPGGVFAPVWNLRDESVPWVAALGTLLGGRHATHEVSVSQDDLGATFEPLETATFPYVQRFTPDGLLDLARSRSYVITMAPERREQVLAGIAELVATHPDLAGRDEFDLPYVTHAYRARKAIRF